MEADPISEAEKLYAWKSVTLWKATAGAKVWQFHGSTGVAVFSFKSVFL